MKSKFLLSVLALVSAGFMPLAATSQIAPDRGAAPAERAEPSFKYEIYAGYGYTSINQVNQSRHGLQGVNVSVTRDFGKYFGISIFGLSWLTNVDPWAMSVGYGSGQDYETKSGVTGGPSISSVKGLTA